ncbi:MLP protein [Quillaja saponaria]|uniref:MLP protein n=1 Tax=Quillaja saponaria TaxID=32244 RepID=A0AAD7KPR1_QUISA|nr:MLP protein [Quillaja saponaria]
MTEFGKVETDVHIKASPEKFHEVFCSRTHHISNVSSGNIQGVVIHEGEWGTVGSVIFWNYTLDGKAAVAKEVVEAIDQEKNLITFKIIEGDLLDHYKSFKITIQVTGKDENGGSVVHWLMEYEKLHGEIPDPHSLLQMAIAVSKDLDAHLTEG